MKTQVIITLSVTFGLAIGALLIAKLGKRKAAQVAMSLPAAVSVLVSVYLKFA